MNVNWFKNPNNMVYAEVDDFVKAFEPELQIPDLKQQIEEFMKDPKPEGMTIKGRNRTSAKVFYPRPLFKERLEQDDNLWVYFGQNQPCYCLKNTEAWRWKAYHFFAHKECEYFPCHETADRENFNCMFCFCPLYCLGRSCGGNYTYYGEIKDCSNCLLPHRRDSYGYILRQYDLITDVMRAQRPEKV